MQENLTAWVGGIPAGCCSKIRLREVLSKFGSVCSVTIRKKAGANKSWAFVTFDLEEGCAAAIAGEVTLTGDNGENVNLRIQKTDKDKQLKMKMEAAVVSQSHFEDTRLMSSRALETNIDQNIGSMQNENGAETQTQVSIRNWKSTVADGNMLDADYYSKFEGGFVGQFADVSAFHGGLDQMIGECRKDILKAIKEEHTAVSSGFGASNQPFMTPNYNIMTTVAREFNFCFLGERDTPRLYDKQRAEIKMDQETTPRQVKDVRALHKNAAALITNSLEKNGNELGLSDSRVKVTDEFMVTKIKLLLEEVCDCLICLWFL